MLALIHLFMVVVSLRVGWAFGEELARTVGPFGWPLGLVPGAWLNYVLSDRISRFLDALFSGHEEITSGDVRQAESDPIPRGLAKALPKPSASPNPQRSPKPGFFRTLSFLILITLLMIVFALPAAASWALGAYAAAIWGPGFWVLGAPIGFGCGMAVIHWFGAVAERLGR